MIILIGGSSHVGKTLIAQKLMEKLHFPYISLDHLKMAFIRTKKTELTVEDDFKMRYFLWPFAAEMVKTAIENEQNMIVEGCYIPREWKESFEKEYLSHIYCTFITMGEDYIRRNFGTIKCTENVIEHRITDDLDMERLIICSEEFRKDCVASGTPNINITNAFDADKLTELILREAGLSKR
ncbi:MAG: adenylate kinase [Treponemataceae bacterium]|nr:adenylate kinase [Treponemataceae bacterium]